MPPMLKLLRFHPWDRRLFSGYTTGLGESTPYSTFMTWWVSDCLGDLCLIFLKLAESNSIGQSNQRNMVQEGMWQYETCLNTVTIYDVSYSNPAKHLRHAWHQSQWFFFHTQHCLTNTLRMTFGRWPVRAADAWKAQAQGPSSSLEVTSFWMASAWTERVQLWLYWMILDVYQLHIKKTLTCAKYGRSRKKGSAGEVMRARKFQPRWFARNSVHPTTSEKSLATRNGKKSGSSRMLHTWTEKNLKASTNRKNQLQ